MVTQKNCVTFAMSKAIGIIPARSGSKGVPNKNIKDLGGIPLIIWTISQAIISQLDEVIFDSDSEEYLEKVANLNICKSLRPSHLATDDALTVDVIKNVCDKFKLKKTDMIILLQPTCPFRSADLINFAVEKLKSNDSASVISVVNCDAFHPLRMKRIVADNLVNYVDTGFEDMRPRQSLPPVFIRSGSIYAAKLDQIKKNNGFAVAQQIPIIEDFKRTINIDTEVDFKIAEEMLQSCADLQSLYRVAYSTLQESIKSKCD